jgi:hypothetical protein
MKFNLQDLGEPDLEFGSGGLNIDPKVGLFEYGPFGSDIGEIEPRILRIGLVGLSTQIESIKKWFSRLEKPILNKEKNVLRFREFPGTTSAFHCKFVIPDVFTRQIDPATHEIASRGDARNAFDELLELYKNSVKSLFGDTRPDCVLVFFPEEIASLRITNPRLTAAEQKVLERARMEEESLQMSLFEPSEDELRTAAELLPQSEELLFRSFHRALKATCMTIANAVPIQVIRRHTFIDAEAKQSSATRAWNLSLALYYKSGNIPWRPHGLTKDTCYVGISFHHLKRRSGDLVYASVANAFSNELEPFILKGATIPRDQVTEKTRQPYLTKDQAGGLISQVVDDYEDRFGTRPARVVVHKTSRYHSGEEAGLREALLSRVSACELVWIAPTGFRLVRRGSFREPLRGTLCGVEDSHTYLYTTGFIPWWDEYPGPHIPAPIEIGTCGESELAERASEILALTKMNWNSTDGIGRYPITVQFARKVGAIMTELDEDTEPNPLYRFYM